jgi:hypothetical protein
LNSIKFGPRYLRHIGLGEQLLLEASQMTDFKQLNLIRFVKVPEAVLSFGSMPYPAIARIIGAYFP